MHTVKNSFNRILKRPISQGAPEDGVIGRASNASGMSDQFIEDVDSDVLSSQLRSKQTYAKPQLPRLRFDDAQLEQSRGTGGRGAITSVRLNKPIEFPNSTKNQTTSFKAFQTTSTSTTLAPNLNSGGTPSSRALPPYTSGVQFVTSPSYRDNTAGAASLRTKFMGKQLQTSERSYISNGADFQLLSPTGGGRRNDGQSANTLISQQDDDVPEELEEDFRSVSTLYNPPPIRSGAPKRRKDSINAEVMEARAELDHKHQTNVKANATDSFSRVFQKRRLANGEEPSESLATGDRPWYYFEGNSTMQSQTGQKLASGDSTAKNARRYQLDQVTVNENPSMAAGNTDIFPGVEAVDASAASGQNHKQQSSSASAAVDPLNSSSNVKSNNVRPTFKALQLRLSDLNEAPKESEPATAGRMTLRSVHDISATESMKEEEQVKEVAYLGGSKAGSIHANADFSLGQVASGQDHSPEIRRKKSKIQQHPPTATKTKITDGVGDVNSALLRQPKERSERNLFITNDKKQQVDLESINNVENLSAQQVVLPIAMRSVEFVSPVVDFRIRGNQCIVGQPGVQANKHVDRFIAGKIQTPSFISSDMQFSSMNPQQRRSDLLIRKKEPSQLDNGRISMDNGVEDFIDSAMNHSMCCSQGNCLRESRLSYPNAAVVINQGRPSLNANKNRPIIQNAGSPTAVQPKIAETESELMMAGSSAFSAAAIQQMQMSYQSGNILPTLSQELGRSHKRRGNASAMRKSTSSARKSIRKSTLDGDQQDVTSFAYHVQNFFSNLFGCCQGTGTVDKNASLRHSLNSSMHSNMLQYSFVAVPNNNNNSGSLDPSPGNTKNAGGANEYRSRAQQMQDFKAAAVIKDKSGSANLGSAVFDTEVDDYRDRADSDIIDDEDHIASAQRPLQAARTEFRTPGDQIETSNHHGNSRQISSVSVQRITAGTVEIATQRSSDASHADEFVYLKPLKRPPQNIAAMNGANPFGTRDRMYSTDSATPQKEQAQYQAPKTLSNPIQYDQDDEEMKKSQEQIIQDEPNSNNPARKKKSLRDMITSVPQQQQQQPQSTYQQQHGQDSFVNSGSPNSYTLQQQEEEQAAMGESFEGDNENEDFEDGEALDVQKIHFNQTVQALFNIRMTNLVEPPFNEIAHLLVDLPEPDHPSKTKTIVFDLDETLIHCVDDVQNDNPDVIIPIQFSEEPEPILAGINIRPFARECLEAANEHFQVVVFTASEQEYADPIIDYLDPDGTLIQARYFRPSCVRTQNPDFYIKDMRIFHQRTLRDIILVDNSVYSFAFQLDNGVPIVGFYHDDKDEEMLHLKFYLECLKDCDDVREKNREAFQLMQLADTQLQRIQEEQQRQMPYEQDEDVDATYPYMQVGGNYRLPDQANLTSSIVEECDDEDEDELARDPSDDIQIQFQHHQLVPDNRKQNQYDQRASRYGGNAAAASGYDPQDAYARQNSNILEEEEEDEEYEEDDASFECQL